jgi:hypothetical protein
MRYRLLLGLVVAGGIAGMPLARTLAAQARPRQLSAPELQQVQVLTAQHDRVRTRLPADGRAQLDKLTAHVRQQLFAAPLRGNLLTLTTRIVNRAIPGLAPAEAETLAAYTLGGIATAQSPPGGIGSVASGSGGQDQLMSATQQMQETQMSFNLQYLQLQSSMQNDARQYTAISNIMKSKAETVKNSIGNLH